jgi:GAF domain-containing protein
VNAAPEPSPGRPDEQLAQYFVEIARSLHSGQEPAEIQDRITRAAVRTVEGCEHAAISLVRLGRRPVTVAATDRLPVEVDAVQYETGEGPCLDAITGAPVYRTGNLEVERRWPAFASRAVERTGVRSMMAFRLVAGSGTIGALNLYSRHRDAFDDHAVAVGAVLAGHAALAVDAVRARRRAENLSNALESSRDIGIAVGILMAQDKITREEAFDRLVRTSQWLNRKLREVAAEVGEVGALPEARPATG